MRQRTVIVLIALATALASVALVVDPGETKIFVRFLAQNLKEPVLRRLRGNRAGVDLVEERLELLSIHLAVEVDFSLTWTIRSLIGPRERFSLL